MVRRVKLVTLALKGRVVLLVRKALLVLKVLLEI